MEIRLFNSRGNTTLLALFVVGVVSSGVYFISNKIIVERKISAQLRKDIRANLALRSITDYIKYGIRKGWCFDEKLIPQPPADCVNNFENNYSTMRIMMPPSYAKTLENLGREYPTEFPNLAGKTAQSLMLKSFERKLDLRSLTISQAHPLHRVLTNLGSYLVKGINIKVSRIGNVTLPVNGDEVYVEILAEFTDKNGNPLKTGVEVYDDDGGLTTNGTQYFREVSRFVSNPREVNTFSLILPGSIYIGKPNPPEPGHGDLAIPLGNKASPGMVFNSPVFVNENIFINKNGYTPVTFNDVVVLGNGIIKGANGSAFKIGESLGVKRYWIDTGFFGGFTRGIDSDGKRDAGLSTLNGVSDSVTLNNDIITQCINIIRSQSNPDMTDASRLVAEPIGGGAFDDKLSEFTNRFSFSEIPTGALNLFVPQVIGNNDGGINLDSGNAQYLNKPHNRNSKDESRIWYSFSPTYNLTSGTKLVMWAYMEWDNNKLKIPLLENTSGDGHKVTINFSPYSKDDVDEAKTQLNSVSSTLNSRQVELAELESEKPTNPVSLTAWLLTSDGTKYAELSGSKFNNKSVAWAQEMKNDVEAEHNQRKNYYDNPGRLEISTIKPNNGFSERQNVFRNVNVKIINGKNFRKASDAGNLIGGLDKTTLTAEPIELFTIEGMDYSAVEGGYSTRPRKFNNQVTNDPSENIKADDNNVHFNFSIDYTNSDRPLVMSNRGRKYDGQAINLGQYKPLNPAINYQMMINKCFDSAGGTNLDAFKPASFASADFTEVSQDSWHFASPDPKTTYFNEDIVSNSFDFKIAATRNTCKIHPNVTTVTGFFVCRNLEILARSAPLKMIGTFIVTKNMTVDPSAINAGVTWASMHNQQAVNIMKQPNASGSPTLRRANGSNCSGLYSGSVPFWHPDPGLNGLADRIRCSSTFLLQGKGPPRWTSIDPDCGRIGDSTNTQCLKRIRNFNLIQLERVYGQ